MKHIPLIARLAMEADVQDGKTFAERERVLYARLKDFVVLSQLATSIDRQEQWDVKVAKSAKNLSKGCIRVRKVVAVDDKRKGEPVQYVHNTKTEENPHSRKEVPLPATEDAFNNHKLLADSGMLKDRFHIPAKGTDLIFEVDVFFKEDGTFQEWVKIDIEMKDIETDLPPLPFEVEEIIYDTTTDPSLKAKIDLLYETVFIRKNKA